MCNFTLHAFGLNYWKMCEQKWTLLTSTVNTDKCSKIRQKHNFILDLSISWNFTQLRINSI